MFNQTLNADQIRTLKQIANGTLQRRPWPMLYWLQQRGYIVIEGDNISVTPQTEMFTGSC